MMVQLWMERVAGVGSASVLPELMVDPAAAGWVVLLLWLARALRFSFFSLFLRAVRWLWPDHRVLSFWTHHLG